jgi:integrase/recombinase XerD
MLEDFFGCPRVRQRLQTHPCAAFLSQYAMHLNSLGCALRTIKEHVRAVEHFTSWLQAQGLSLAAVNSDIIRTFLGKHLPTCRCPAPASTCRHHVRPALQRMLRLLQDQGAAEPTSSAAFRLIDAALQPYRFYLRETCGLSEGTCRDRVRFAREFLRAKFGRRAVQWEVLRPKDVMDYMAEYAHRRPRSVQKVASSLRRFLRYLQFQGWCGPSMVAAVPHIPQWRLAHTPKTLTDQQLHEFLAAFDRTTAVGRRDYAMALCQTILGLRVGEVAVLRLEDVDWRAGVLRIVSGKTRRTREIPLAARVGKAIAAYLRQGRPATSCRNLFVRHRIRHGMPVSKAVIREIIRDAYAKVNGCRHLTGTHVLRHTAATRMQQRGVSLKELADVLGHRSIDTTALYAKVDLPRLAAVARPWPEAQP